MTDPSFPDALPAQYMLHWYVLERVLGQGGFGITYLARDSNLDKLVAIKEYLPVDTATRRADATVSPRGGTQSERYASGLEGFIREARTLARFSHPNIVRVHSVFQHNNTAYMVMEYEEGETLAALLARRQTLSERELHNIMLPIIDGLSLVHAAGFIHRDIKPENILIRKDSSPVLLDFGSARSGMGQSRTVTILVAPGYAPFEQYYANGESQGPWTDIYGLGATCYRAIAGEPPLDAIARSKGVLGSTREMLVPAAERGARRYSPQLLAAVDHALAFAERDRPQTLAEWKHEFTDGVGQPVAPAAAAAPAQGPATNPAPGGPGLREKLAWAGVAVLALLAFALWQRSSSSDSDRLAQIERQLGSQRGASEPASAPRTAAPALPAVMPVSSPVVVLPAAPPVAAAPATPAPAPPAKAATPVAPAKVTTAAAPKVAPKPAAVTPPSATPATVPTIAPVAVSPPVAPPVAIAPAPTSAPVASAAPAVATPAPAPVVRQEPAPVAVPRAPEVAPPSAPPSDDKEAFAFYRVRAQTGDGDAMFRLGEMYAQGKGVAQSNNQSYLWFGLAACSGHAGARSRKAQVAERLQPAELRVADRQVESIGKGCK